MNSERTFVIDFVAKGETSDEWKLVLVEQGPWSESIDKQLKRVQERLYDAIDAALDGRVAEKFPDSRGKNFVIELDGYDLPKVEVADFFERFSSKVLAGPDYRQALKDNCFVHQITFQINFQSVN
jgi:hypothetical protein